jgi:predicted ribosomally synthesized six-cysteine peptide SCIFF
MKKHITTITKGDLAKRAAQGGCGECAASCQSACKTSCTVGNQVCEKSKK